MLTLCREPSTDMQPRDPRQVLILATGLNTITVTFLRWKVATCMGMTTITRKVPNGVNGLANLVRSILPVATALTAPQFRALLAVDTRWADHVGTVLVLPDVHLTESDIKGYGAYVLDEKARDLFAGAK